MTSSPKKPKAPADKAGAQTDFCNVPRHSKVTVVQENGSILKINQKTLQWAKIIHFP